MDMLLTDEVGLYVIPLLMANLLARQES